MLKKFVFLFIVGFYTVNSAHAQKGRNVHDHLLIKASDQYLYGDPAQQYEGTPYLNKEFEPGFVYVNGTKSKQMLLRFNIFADHIELKEDDGLYLIAPNQALTRVEIGKHVLVGGKDGFLELLEDGKLKLLTKKIINYRQAVIVTNVPAKYSPPSDIFYYVLDNGKPVKVNSVKKMIASLPDKQTELTQLAEKEKLSRKGEDELMRLVQYYNSF